MYPEGKGDRGSPQYFSGISAKGREPGRGQESRRRNVARGRPETGPARRRANRVLYSDAQLEYTDVNVAPDKSTSRSPQATNAAHPSTPREWLRSECCKRSAVAGRCEGNDGTNGPAQRAPTAFEL